MRKKLTSGTVPGLLTVIALVLTGLAAVSVTGAFVHADGLLHLPSHLSKASIIDNNSQALQVVITVTNSDGIPATGAQVTVVDSRDARLVFQGNADTKGEVLIPLGEERGRALGEGKTQSITDVPYKVLAITTDGESWVYNFSRSYVNVEVLQRDEGLSAEEAVKKAESIELGFPQRLEIATKPVTEGAGQAQLLDPTPEKLAVQGETTTQSCVLYKRQADTDEGDHPVEIGEVHTGGYGEVGVTFNYSANAGNDIEVATNYSGSWSGGGGYALVRAESGWNVTWPEFFYITYRPKSNFHFHREYWAYDCGFSIDTWDEIHADRYDGGADYIVISQYGDGAPWQEIEANQHGAWASYVPASEATYNEGNGYTIGGAFSVVGLSLSAKTHFDTYARHYFDFEGSAPKYYLYDDGLSTWKVIFVSRK